MLLSPFSFALVGWSVLFLVWFIGFFGNKRTVKIEHWVEQSVVSGLFLVGFFLLGFPNAFGWLGLVIVPAGALNWIGALLVFGSVGFAIWARMTLGKNWSGAVITLKEDHELVTDGPYALVRHPIYTGFLGAAIGTAFSVGTVSGFLGTAAILAGFLIRIRREEELMTAQFPNEYPAYKQRTKALVPFVI